ncbi:helix-turn-helix domain-containing protein [Glaciimonas immobilis]|uniref:Transcriptional regulator with XRE-family HTH domain n=1 Tax=Glaciimonas immobilis TaxID=728004 RepID=A0A840RUM5_9BURK|nr:helix-turn-helix transcriptional regulator [Glaciimonas immobilis]KAF3999826.1 helix-turn-helix transcriptional regulator [Glaciimonas immobilis]MBB5200301.1 transcriptional regulator with XRE-family HTH domain [Glaciimonas immobilis]
MNTNHELALGQSIGKVLGFYRKKIGLTQDQVAERLGVERETISRFERGAVIPPIPRLFELAEIYGCTAGELLTQGSARALDQAEDIANMLGGMNESDRKLALAIMRELSAHLK